MPVINPKTGREYHWAYNLWTPRTRSRWHKQTTGGGVVQGSVRGIAHLDWMNRRSITLFNTEIEVIQSAWNTTVAASAGTHDFDLVYDLYIPGVGWWRQQRFFRNHGFWSWYRHPPLFGNHIHGFCMVPYAGDPSRAFADRGFKVGEFIDGGWSTSGNLIASSQAADQVDHAFGLANAHASGSDQSWFPADPKAKTFVLMDYINRRKAVQAAA